MGIVKTVSLDPLVNATGIMTEKATSKSEKSYGTADFTGAFFTAHGARFNGGRTVSLTTKAASTTYKTDVPIVLTGKRGGTTVTESLTPTKADGGEVLHGKQVFDFGPDETFGVYVPGQSGTGGGISVGVEDAYAPVNAVFEDVFVRNDGDLALLYQDGSTDVLSLEASSGSPILYERAQIGTLQPHAVLKETTCTGVSLCWGPSTRRK